MGADAAPFDVEFASTGGRSARMGQTIAVKIKCVQRFLNSRAVTTGLPNIYNSGGLQPHPGDQVKIAR